MRGKNGFFERINYPLIGFSNIMFYEIISENLGVNEKDNILDIGTGTGYSAMRFAVEAQTVVGIDISKEAIDFLNSVNKKSNLCFKNFDACDKSFKDEYAGKFTKVYSSDVLEHVENPQGFVEAIGAVLQSGGKAVITFPNSKNHGRNYFLKIDELRRLFEDSRLKIMDFKVVRLGFLPHLLSQIFYFIPLSIFQKLRSKKEIGKNANEFDKTWCFQRRENKKSYDALFNLYFELLMAISKLMPLFSYEEPEGNILDSRVLIIAQK